MVVKIYKAADLVQGIADVVHNILADQKEELKDERCW